MEERRGRRKELHGKQNFEISNSYETEVMKHMREFLGGTCNIIGYICEGYI